MTVTWLIRYGHVLGGAFWVGGYALLALVVIPLMRKSASEALLQVTLAAIRALTYAGTVTIFFGVVLITRSRGTAALLRGEWGALIIASLVIAVVLLGIGDGALRPAVRRMAVGDDGRAAQRYALIGLALTVLAIGLMTRALYAGS